MKKTSNFWVYRPFNHTFFLLWAFFIGLLTLGSFLLNRLPLDARKTVYVTVCLITFAAFFVYKHCLSVDEEYDRLYGDLGGFNWWGELPLQLCNINMIFMPIAVFFNLRPLMSFSFFVGPLGASIALLMPVNGFDKYPITLPRMMGYLYNHYMIVIQSIALVTLKFYYPDFADFFPTLIAFFFIALAVFLWNCFLRKTGLHPHANYFYLSETEGNPVLELFHKWIPVPFWYGLPCMAVLAVYMLVILWAFKLAR